MCSLRLFVERIAFLIVPFLSRLCFVLMSCKYISDLYESEGEEYTNPSYFPINTSESFVNRYLTPTHTNYSPENQTNTRYSLGLSPHLDQQSFENSSSRKNKTSVAQM